MLTLRPIATTLEEARLAAEDKLVEIRRPIEGLSPNAKNVRYLGPYLKCDAPPGSETASLRIDCPWGGGWQGLDYADFAEYLYVQESWAAHWMYNDLPADEARSTHPGDNRWFQADGEEALGSSGCPAAGRRGRWREAAEMPIWASRFAYRSRRVSVDRQGDGWIWVVMLERVNKPNGAPVPPAEMEERQ